MKMIPFASYELNEHKWKRKCTRLTIALIVAIAIIIGNMVWLFTYFGSRHEIADIPCAVSLYDERVSNSIPKCKVAENASKTPVNTIPLTVYPKKRGRHERHI